MQLFFDRASWSHPHSWALLRLLLLHCDTIDTVLVHKAFFFQEIEKLNEPSVAAAAAASAVLLRTINTTAAVYPLHVRTKYEHSSYT